jgi:hypothetical protein
MKLIAFTTFHNSDVSQIVGAHFVIADSDDPNARKEWIEAQVSIVVPTVRNGADLRARVLEKARDALDTLAKDFRRLDENLPRGR